MQKRNDIVRGACVAFLLVTLISYAGCSESEDPLGDSNRAPAIPGVVSGTDVVMLGYPVEYTSSAFDPDGDALTVIFIWGDGDSSLVSLAAGDSLASAEHTYNSLGSYRIFVVAKDPSGLRSDSSAALRIQVFPPGPLTPAMPTGADTVFVDTLFAFSASTINPLGIPYFLTFDWGDGSSFTTTAKTDDTGLVVFTQSHIYFPSDLGLNYIRVKAEDDSGHVTEWSPAKTVNVINRAPLTPDVPEGDTLQVAGNLLEFRASTVDPEGDNIKIVFAWGDGTKTETQYDHHKTIFTRSHRYSDTGVYEVRARARDVLGNESDFSEPLIVHLPTFPIDTIIVTESGLSNYFAEAKRNVEGIMFLYRDASNEEHRFAETVWNLFEIELSKNLAEQVLYFDTVGTYQYRCLNHPGRTSEEGQILLTP